MSVLPFVECQCQCSNQFSLKVSIANVLIDWLKRTPSYLVVSLFKLDDKIGRFEITRPDY